jgi:uncharacterized protein
MAMNKEVMKDLIQAMANKDTLKKGVLQLLKSGLDAAEKEKKSPLTKEEEIAVVHREVKQTKDFIKEAQKLNRTDLVEDAEEKLKILYTYLPKQLSETEVEQALLDLGVKQGMNMGQAMSIAMPNLKGKTENALISKTVQKLIR